MLALPSHSVVLLTPSISSLSLSSLFLQAVVNICAVAQGTDIAGGKKRKKKDCFQPYQSPGGILPCGYRTNSAG